MKVTSGKGKTVTHHKLIKRLFNGLPVEDAKSEMVIHTIASDIKRAKRGDPQNCVFAKACERKFGSHNTAFFRQFAYVEKENRVMRFALPKPTRDSILVWDRAGKAQPDGYRLCPPSPSATLDAKLAQSRNRVREPWPTGRKKKRKNAPDDFRNGTGMLKFMNAQNSR